MAGLAAALAVSVTTARADGGGSVPPGQSDASTTFRFGAPWEAENRVDQGSRVGDTVYVAGQFSHDRTGRFVGEGDVAEQTRQTFANLDTVLAGLGASKRGIVELEVFLIDPKKNLGRFVTEYKNYVSEGHLTVTLVGVTALAYPEELVEIRAVARATQAR